MPEPKGTTPKESWTSMAYSRSKWVRVKYGETIKEPNEQASNNSLRDDEVLLERAEPIGTSAAFPLGGGSDKPTGGIAPITNAN
jgi:hypothetical protein